MSSGDLSSLVAVLTAAAGLVAAIVGALKYFNYRTKKDRVAAVGMAFEAVVEALASSDEVKRMAAAIRLRRFFDPRAELATGGLGLRLRRLARTQDGAGRPDERSGTSGPDRGITSEELPYAADAVNVIVAILRNQPPGNFQKLLADALTRAPKTLLVGADLQRANLQNAWLGRIELPEADFYRADLSSASFKEGRVQRAQFYEARLARTRFVHARVDGANFFGADLSGADFSGATLQGASFAQAAARRVVFRQARLEGASFDSADLEDADFRAADLVHATFHEARLAGAAFEGARNVPDEIATRLRPDGTHPGNQEARETRRRVFLSQSAVLTAEQQAIVDRVAHLIEEDAEVVRLHREDYPASGSLAEIRRLMGSCSAVVILGLPQLHVAHGTLRAGTTEQIAVRDASIATPWNQIEAGMAFALGMPMLVVRSQLGDEGVFGIRNEASTLTVVDLDECGDLARLDEAIARWMRTLSSF
jgi:Pentapeptide repeats (9 copies)/Pentapeptide repeats (8 copies)